MIKKVLLFFGTRPEAIKMAPVALEMLKSEYFDVKIGISGQHKDLVAPVIDFFGLKVDFDLKIASHCRNIEDPLAVGLPRLSGILREQAFDYIFVHGDTSTTLLGSLAGFYTKTPVVHIEAGLRSHSMDNPYPEEMNRKLTAGVAKYNFTPTRAASANLLREGVKESAIFRTGNTVVDALQIGAEKLKNNSGAVEAIEKKMSFLPKEDPWILLTIHRNENINQTLIDTMNNTLHLGRTTGAVVLFPMHPNPKIHRLAGQSPLVSDRMHILPPLDYPEMIWLYQKLSLIVTDSGGIQEEAASFGIPTLVTRDITERQETIASGLTTLVGKDLSLILTEGQKKIRVLDRSIGLDGKNPYGDGHASEKIRKVMEWQLNKSEVPSSHIRYFGFSGGVSL